MFDSKALEINNERQIDTAANELLTYIKANIPYTDVEKVDKAIKFAKKAHSKQKRASGEPFILHPIAVSMIIAQLHLDTTSIIVALLHDVIEDTEFTEEDIAREFGTTEATLVKGLTKLHQIETKPGQIKQAENLRKLLIAVSDDIRILIIKLADRLHNMRTLHFFYNKQKKIRIANDTLEIYAPLAERIGLQSFKNELYDLSFKELYSDIRNSIIKKIAILKVGHGKKIDTIIGEIKKLFIQNNVNAEVMGREKSPFSIWKKIEEKNIIFEQLSDIFGIRIITDNILNCYKILGLIHTYYIFVPTHFYDYISNPKLNGYKSLHTVIMADNNEHIEVQIRTSEMHEISEIGVAAHWIYKQNDEGNNDIDAHYKWLKRIKEILDKTKESQDIIHNTKLEIYHNQVFCLTTSGEIIILPKDATPLDFAFELDASLAPYYGHALVNNNFANITTPLQNGDQVEIITGDSIAVKQEWYDIVRTGKAKAEIKIQLERQTYEEIISIGRILLKKKLEDYKVEYSDMLLLKILKKFSKSSVEDLLYDIGCSQISATDVINTIIQQWHWMKIKYFIKILKNFFIKDNTDVIDIETLESAFDIKFPYCCSPIYNKVAYGVYSKNVNNSRISLVVHAKSCHNLKNLKTDVIKLIWSKHFSEKTPITMEIILNENINAISLLFNVFTEYGISNYNIRTQNKSEEQNLMIVLHFEIIANSQLNGIINSLRLIDDIVDVKVL